MGYGDHDDHVIWMNYVIPMASRIVMIYPWKIIPYHTNKGYWGRVSSIRHVNTLWCLSPESFLGFWGTWKNRLWSQTICPSSVMSCLFWDDDWSLRSWHPFYRWIFAANLTSVLFFMWTDQFLEKIRLGFVFQSQFLDHQIIFSQGWTETAFFRVELHQGAAWEILWELGLSRGRACHEWGLSTKPCLITIENYYNIYR